MPVKQGLTAQDFVLLRLNQQEGIDGFANPLAIVNKQCINIYFIGIHFHSVQRGMRFKYNSGLCKVEMSSSDCKLEV